MVVVVVVVIVVVVVVVGEVSNNNTSCSKSKRLPKFKLETVTRKRVDLSYLYLST